MANNAVPTLPDYLRPGLDLVLIGINPGLYSAKKGHYFARKNSRFWPAFSASRLSSRMREGLGVTILGPEHDRECPHYGIGLTDVVKRVTANAAELTVADFSLGVPLLITKLERMKPRVACFHGPTGYRPFLAHWRDSKPEKIVLGEQSESLGPTRFFVVPNPSPANAHCRPTDLVGWYDRLHDFLLRATP